MNSQKPTLSAAVTTVISQSMSGFSMLIPLASVIFFGVFGGVAYSVTGVLAFLLFAFVSRRVKALQNDEKSLSDFLQQRLSKRGFRLMVVTLMLNSVAVMCMQEVAAGMILRAMFSIQFAFTEVLYVLILIALVTYLRIRRMNRLSALIVPLYFTTAILLPLYFFLSQGVSQIYDGISLYHPYLLVTNYTDISRFLLATTLISFGQLLLQTVFWRSVFSMDPGKIKPTFSISGMAWGTLSLAFSTLVWLMIYTGIFENMQSIIDDILHKIHSSSLLGLFLLCLSTATVCAFASEVKVLVHLSTTVLPQRSTPPTVRQRGVSYAAILCLSLASFLILFYFQPSLLDVLLFFGIVYASAVPPTLAILLRRKRQNDFIPASALLCIAIGIGLCPLIGYLNAVMLSAAVSTLFLFVARRGHPCEG